jgi:hypothetical protein
MQSQAGQAAAFDQKISGFESWFVHQAPSERHNPIMSLLTGLSENDVTCSNL